MNEYYVYILQCSDRSYYTGVTNDYEERVAAHKRGNDSSAYTFSRRPIKLVYMATFSDIHEAISWEKRVKRWTRKKKEALTRGDFEMLPCLSLNAKRKRIYTIIKSNNQKIIKLCHGEPGRTMI